MILSIVEKAIYTTAVTVYRRLLPSTIIVSEIFNRLIIVRGLRGLNNISILLPIII